jgi:hypothetical protein
MTPTSWPCRRETRGAAAFRAHHSSRSRQSRMKAHRSPVVVRPHICTAAQAAGLPEIEGMGKQCIWLYVHSVTFHYRSHQVMKHSLNMPELRARPVTPLATGSRTKGFARHFMATKFSRRLWWRQLASTPGRRNIGASVPT